MFLMVLALVVGLLLPDWFDTGTARPVWLLAAPIVLGLVGAVIAIRGGRPLWAAASALWGFLVLQGIIVLTTLIGGP